MGFLDDIVGNVAGGTSGQTLVTSVLQMLTSQQGGVTGLAQAFQQKGLGDIAASWIGTGGNLPVSAQQLQQVLGSEQIQAFAQQAGIPADAAGSHLAQLLPSIVDRLTPGGKIPEGGDLMSAGTGLLQSLMGRGKPAQ